MIHIAIATELANFVIGLIQALGYPGIFVLMLLEGLLLPIPSEVVMAFGGYLAFSGGLLESDIKKRRFELPEGEVKAMLGDFYATTPGSD